jgi:hypothetical protein
MKFKAKIWESNLMWSCYDVSFEAKNIHEANELLMKQQDPEDGFEYIRSLDSVPSDDHTPVYEYISGTLEKDLD